MRSMHRVWTARSGWRGGLARLALALALSSLLALGLMAALASWVRTRCRERIYEALEDVPARRVAIVFGAGVWPGGQLTPVLADRVWTAAALYQAGKVEKLLLTGDNRFVHYNEPKHMKEYAMRLGVPEADIVLDYAGRRTYDSCYRAIYIFGVPDAILVTQRFHLPRALFTCHSLGLEAVGLAADRRPYLGATWYLLREIPASAVAWLDVHLFHPTPVLGEKLPIFASR